MSDPHRSIVKLQSCLCELRAELSAKQTTVVEQRERISSLIAENERLRGRIGLHSTEVAQKDIETQQLRDRLRKLEVQHQEDGQLLRASIADFESFKSKVQLEGLTKDATIRKLQMETDGLILVNDDLQEAQKQKKTELDAIVADCNRKLHQAIQNEREKVKTVLEHCRVVITRLSTKVKESNDRSLLLENEMRTKMETMQSFREDMAEQKRIYGEWVDLLRQQINFRIRAEPTQVHGEAELEQRYNEESSLTEPELPTEVEKSFEGPRK